MCSLFLFLAFLILAGCSYPRANVLETRKADAKLISEGESNCGAPWAAKDIGKLVDIYADDASIMVPGIATMTGKAAIRAGIEQSLADPNFSINCFPAQVEVSIGGDLAYSKGTYTTVTTDPKTKQPIAEKGRYLTVYRKAADGKWKAIQDINNAGPPDSQ
jgi:uncharacterized protein (TIGR02246 family)